MGRQRTRVFTGCSRCRTRKIKCDEGRPACAACTRLGRPCPGYGIKLAWVQEDTGKAQPIPDGLHQRTVLPCDTTWKGFAILPPDLVDSLIDKCGEEDNSASHKIQSSSCSPTLWLSVGHNPFGVFPAARPRKRQRRSKLALHPAAQPEQQPGQLSESLPWTPPQPPTPSSTISVVSPQQPPSPASAALLFHGYSPSLARTMVAFPDATDNERFLFHHYVSHVADIMVPYEHPWNPWKRVYPAAALHQQSPYQKALHSAILAHAAFNVAHLRGGRRGGEPKMLDTGARIYGTAIKQLLPYICDGRGEFADILAAVMNLMFAEIFSGETHTWRRHFKGAWMLFERCWASRPWEFPDSACLSLQSLIIVKIIGATSEWDVDSPGHSLDRQVDLSQNLDTTPQTLAPILFTPEFGFSIGAPRVVLQCIASITDFRTRRRRRRPALVAPGEVDRLLHTLLGKLNAYRALEGGEDDPVGENAGEFAAEQTLALPPRPRRVSAEARAQRRAFLDATYIYLYRVLLDVPPSAVQAHVRQTFANVDDFFVSCCLARNFSIWPAFIAAAEAYTERDLAVARRWLEGAMTFGSGNRHAVRRVLEEVWRRRAAAGGDPGSVAVDWRQVMHELDCDVMIA